MKIKRHTKNKQQRSGIIFLTLIFIVLIIGVFIKTVFVKDEYIMVEFLVSGGEWWWDTAHPPYWLGDPIVPGAAEYTIQGKKLVDVIDVEKFNEGNRKTIYMKAKLLATKNPWTDKYRFKQTPLEIGATILVAPNHIQLYANVIGIEGVTKKREIQKRTVKLALYNVYPWMADAISVGDQMVSSSGEVFATILNKQVLYAEKTIIEDGLSKDAYSLLGVSNKPTYQQTYLYINKADYFKRDIIMTAEIETTKTSNSEFFAYYLPVKVGDVLILNLPKTIITPFITDIQ